MTARDVAEAAAWSLLALVAFAGTVLLARWALG